MATRQTRGNAAARRPAKKAAPVAARRTTKKDVSEYATKPATPYQKAFANWAVKEVGFDPETASSKRAAFLRGLVIGVAARPMFNESEFLADWRERTGETKRGPKPKTETTPTSNRRTRRAPEAVEPEDFEDEESEESDDDFEDDDDADADDDDDADESDDDDDDADDDDFEDEEVEEAPKRPAKKAAPRKATATRTPQRSGTAKARKATKPAATEDDDYLF